MRFQQKMKFLHCSIKERLKHVLDVENSRRTSSTWSNVHASNKQMLSRACLEWSVMTMATMSKTSRTTPTMVARYLIALNSYAVKYRLCCMLHFSFYSSHISASASCSPNAPSHEYIDYRHISMEENSMKCFSRE